MYDINEERAKELLKGITDILIEKDEKIKEQEQKIKILQMEVEMLKENREDKEERTKTEEEKEYMLGRDFLIIKTIGKLSNPPVEIIRIDKETCQIISDNETFEDSIENVLNVLILDMTN